MSDSPKNNDRAKRKNRPKRQEKADTSSKTVLKTKKHSADWAETGDNETPLEPRRGKRFIDVLLAPGIQTQQSRISHLTVILFLVGFITAVAFGYEWSVAIPIALILGLHKFLLLIQTKQNLDQLIEVN